MNEPISLRYAKVGIHQDRSRQKEELWLHVFKDSLVTGRALFGCKPTELAAKEADEALRLYVERFESAPVTIQ